ncbi:prepilin-type N-terminal cleavage/methylation domain-containing protein, partial [bacterium]|nr:prepilin-type N-terminal cleavage/methylation domain-containing protein [bacterium]
EYKMRKEFKKGLTLLEVMVVIGIIGIITTASFITLSKTGHKYKLRSSTIDLGQTINYVRQYSLEKNRNYGIRFYSDSMTVFYTSGTDTILDSGIKLPAHIKIGVNSEITQGIGGTSIPTTGTTFANNTFLSHPHSGVTPGIVYFSSPVESRAYKINKLGYANLYQWGGGTWNEQ